MISKSQEQGNEELYEDELLVSITEIKRDEDDSEFCVDLVALEKQLESIQSLIAEDLKLSKDLVKVDRQLKHHYQPDRMQANLMDDRSRILIHDVHDVKKAGPVNGIMRLIPALFK